MSYSDSSLPPWTSESLAPSPPSEPATAAPAFPATPAVYAAPAAGRPGAAVAAVDEEVEDLLKSLGVQGEMKNFVDIGKKQFNREISNFFS